MRIGDRELDLGRPQVMTIINVTPDSFYAGSRTLDTACICERVERAVTEGASILDVGGYSSRPGAAEVPVEEELRRVAIGVEAIRRVAPHIPISLDTFRSQVARAVIDRFGPCLVNDISAGTLDPDMAGVVARYRVPYIAMHMRANPATMQAHTDYGDVTAEVMRYFEQALQRLRQAGVHQVILDPGFGFAKTTRQNYELLAGMDRLGSLGCPVLAGISRKSMIYKVLECTPEDSLAGTTALHWECLRRGAAILRVHDTRAAADVVRLFEYYRAQRGGE